MSEAPTSDNESPTILVTGGAGFIGSNFIKYVLDRHHDWTVINLDKLTYAGNLANLQDVEKKYGSRGSGEEQNSRASKPDSAGNSLDKSKPRYHFIKGDIKNRELVNSIFSGSYFEESRSEEFPSPLTSSGGFLVDAVVNFAAESHVDRSVQDAAPFVETNVKGTQTLLDAAKKYWLDETDELPLNSPNFPTFVQISTDEVYGSLGKTGEFTENSPLEPNNPYSASKASADMLCRSYYQAYNFPVKITRSSNNYGPYQFPEKLIPLMIRNALRGEELPVYGEGKEVRDWLFVKDNCGGIDKVLRRGKTGGVYNIGGDAEKQNIEVVNNICRILEEEKAGGFLDAHYNFKDLIKFIEDPRGGAHDFRYALDSNKIQDELDWEPEYDFRGGLKRTVKWYLNNQDWVKAVVTGEYEDYYEDFYGQS